MTIELEIENEDEFPLMRECVEDVRNIWIKHDKPETEDGPTTETGGCTHATGDSMGDYATDGDVDAYNSIIDDLYRLVGIIHIGSGIWYMQYHSTATWDEFETEANERIDEYIENHLWDEFSSSTLWEGE